jgi:ribosomal protein S6
MREYELVVVVRPSLSEGDRKKTVDTIKGWLGETKIVKEDDWGQRPLSYPIKHEESGHYYFFQLESEEGLPSNLEQRILRDDTIIRHLVLRTK